MKKSEFPVTAFCDLMKASASVFRVLFDLTEMDFLPAEKRNELMAIAASIEDFAIQMKLDYYG